MDTDTAIRTVRSALQRYGFVEGAALELVKYRENYVFRLTEPAGMSYAVRLHRAGYRTDAEIRTELAYLKALAERGMSVPEIVPAVNGELVCLVGAEDGETFYLDVQKWLEASTPLGDVAEAFAGIRALEPEAFRQLGVLTGELHRHTMTIGRTPGFERSAWDVEGLVGAAPLWGTPLAVEELSHEQAALLTRALAKLRAELEAIGTAPESYGVIHADLTLENVLVQDGRLIVIDFDDFGEGWHLFDLTTALFFLVPHPRYEDYRRALLEGYRSARPVPDSFFEAWDALLLARGMTYLGWAADRRGDDTAEFIVEQVLPVVLGLAARYAPMVSSPVATSS
ncbi:phosphotransferase enzyme family protein [Kocuria arenosa]|uniref:phosphotransferase enzyme family protein n=1 Tax=Kocuria arenosa TaxID=3071446 RepID=UPI0034D60F0A